jgi:hypothetical protein
VPFNRNVAVDVGFPFPKDTDAFDDRNIKIGSFSFQVGKLK